MKRPFFSMCPSAILASLLLLFLPAAAAPTSTVAPTAAAAAADPSSPENAVIPGIGPVGDVVQVQTGFAFTEGPAADAEGNLYFSDTRGNTIFRVDAAGELTRVLPDSQRANGLMFNRYGRLYACQSGAGRIISIDVGDKSIDVLADGFQQQPFARPNDLVIDAHGGVYFSDRAPQGGPGTMAGYYLQSNGKVRRAISDLKLPNGVLLSPDESTLYVMFAEPRLMAYPITAPGRLGAPRVFCELVQPPGGGRGGDGLSLDTRGNLYLTVPAMSAVQVVSPQGETLGLIHFPEAPSNCAFGGPDMQTLYVTARTSLYKVRMQATGHRFASSPRPDVVLTPAAEEIHRTGLLMDGHNDLPWKIRTEFGGSLEQARITRRHDPDGEGGLETDIPRLREGGVGAQFWSAYVPAATMLRGESLRQTLEQIALVHEMVHRYPEVFEMAGTADDIERIHAAGKIASMIGIEGGHSIEDSLGNLGRLYELGARYMTLTHSDTLAWADSATDEARHGGLTPFGESVVSEMNRLGMLVDISHVSPDTMRDALRVTRAPVIASHSSAYAVAEHVRNVPDDVLRLVAENGGVVMVNFYSGFVVPESARVMKNVLEMSSQLHEKYPDEREYKQAMNRWRRQHPIEPGTIHAVVDHIDHIVRTAGVDHVGLGSDFDGVSSLPRQLEDVATYPLITQELLNRGYEPDEIHKIMGGNVVRALRRAEVVARRMQQEEGT